MDSPVIGIKIANGTYFPILKEEDRIKKRVILTPVAEGQTDVKIDIFRGDGEGMFNPVYVASLILNNIEPAADNSIEIELLIGISDDNILDAEAYDPVSGEKQLLSISMEAVDETDFFEIPDEEESTPYFNAEMADEDFDSFSLDEETGDFSEHEDLSDESDIFDSEELSIEDEFDENPESDELPQEDELSFNDDLTSIDIEDEESRFEEPAAADIQNEGTDNAAPFLYDYEDSRAGRKNSALKIAIVFLSIVFLIFLVLLIYTIIKKPAMAEEGMKEETKQEVVIGGDSEKAEKPVKTPPPAARKPAAAEKKTPPAEKKATPVPVKKAAPVAEAEKSVRYRIKKGDTLWDISAAYYRTPWKYKKIAKDNNIKNPDLIFTGTYLNIKE